MQKYPPNRRYLLKRDGIEEIGMREAQIELACLAGVIAFKVIGSFFYV